ncbi:MULTISPECIES: HutD/Ves family protein [Ochrobactrum]|uniref:HutD/Ves family protein n=1 Tax=Ochrobactrum sp. C6C9 TaxID=2736662 RepID=UPI0035304BBC|nr:HutD family protein [Ochrobactrum sp. C6C9]
MAVALLKAENHRRMPWKNGGGVTVEIAIHPQGASVDDFDWRVSMASVANDGPFSLFPGIDRSLSVLEGDGIVLDVEGHKSTLTRESEPFAFAADSQSSAQLIGSVITDLNVMTRRGRYTHHVRRITGNEAATTLETGATGETLLIFCAEGEFALQTDTGLTHLGSHDAVVLDGLAASAIEIKGKGDLFLITIIAIGSGI